MVLELNASDERGINVVRDLIKSFAGSGTLSRYEFNQIKESKRQTCYFRWGWYDDKSCTIRIKKKYFFLYNKVIEKYHSNARFCLVSNYVSKIIPALQSRCTRFKFKQISFEEAKNRII